MKTISKLVLVILISLPLLSIGQNEEVAKLIDKYKGKRGVSVITFNTGAFEFDLAEHSESEELEMLMDQVEKVQIMHIDKFYRYASDEFDEQVKKMIKENDYKLLIDVTSDDENLKVYILNGEKNRILEGLIVAQEDDEFSLIWVHGNMNLQDFLHSHHHFHRRHF